ncbi:MAG: hypothetical protein AB7P23_04795 [Amphiplicatus sp.]
MTDLGPAGLILVAFILALSGLVGVDAAARLAGRVKGAPRKP